MKVFYLNDERKPITVQINHHFVFDPNNPLVQPKIEYVTLQACESRVFDIEAPVDAIPYVKKWPNQVLLTYLPAEAQSQTAFDT
jgi:hypothetical protein